MGGGTGSAFAVIPAQNATGNWIKVVQRVPVRIALDPAGDGGASAARRAFHDRHHRYRPDELSHDRDAKYRRAAAAARCCGSPP